MKNPYFFKRLLHFSAFALLIFSFSCKKEASPTYAQFPIELTTAAAGSGTKLTWTKVETSDFIDYTIVRSTGDSIPELSQIVGNPTASIVTRIADPKITTFTDPAFSTQAVRTHYRVFARLNRRNLSSPNVLVNADLLDLGTGFNEIISNSDKNKPLFYMAGSFSNTLLCYDGNADRIVTSSPVLPFSAMRLAIASKNGVDEEIAAFGSSNTVSFFDAKTLKSTGTLQFGNASVVASAAGTTDGFFIFVTSESINNIKVVSIISHTIISQYTLSLVGNVPLGSVMTKNPSTREFIMRDPTVGANIRITRIQYTEQGQVVDSSIMGFISIGFSTSTPVLRVSTNGDMFIIGNGIYSRASLLLRTNLFVSNGASYADFTFGVQNDKIFALSANTSVGFNLDEFDPLTYKYVRSRPVKVIGLRCFATDNAFILFSNGSNARTVVQKIKI